MNKHHTLPKNAAFLNKPIYIFTKAAITLSKKRLRHSVFTITTSEFSYFFRANSFAEYLWVAASLFKVNKNTSRLSHWYRTYIKIYIKPLEDVQGVFGTFLVHSISVLSPKCNVVNIFQANIAILIFINTYAHIWR